MRLINILILLFCATSFPLQGQEVTTGYPSICNQAECGQRNWIDVGYANYWLDGFTGPALASQATAGTDRADAGILGRPTTSVLRDGELGAGMLSGVRINGGHYLDGCGVYSLTGSFLYAGGSETDRFPTNADSIIARPFFNSDPNVNAQDSELVNFPGVVSGSLGIDADTDIYSGSIALQRRISCCFERCCCTGRRIDVLLGYRAFVLDEELRISEQLEPTVGLFAPGTQIAIEDSFQTRNTFHGIELGLLTSLQRQRWEFNLGARVAIGNIRQRVQIAGSTVTTVPGSGAASQPFGFLAAPSNIGEYDRDEFGVLTDTQFRAGYWISSRAKVYLGYNVLFINSVVRPGDVVDTRLNPTQIDPNQVATDPAEPRFSWSDESLLLHGIQAGIEFRF